MDIKTAGLSLVFAIANVTETSPALTTEVWSGNTDQTLDDIFGRSYTLALSMEF